MKGGAVTMAIQLTNSDWAYLSQMIYRINQCTTYEEYADTVLQHIRTMIPYTKGIVFQANKHQGLIRMEEPYANNINGRDFDESLYVNGCYSAKWAKYMYIPWSNVFRYSDICSDEEWTQTPIYRDILQPQNLHYGLYTTLIHKDYPVGAVVLWREKGLGDFNDREMMIMDTMKIHYELKLFQLLSEKKPLETAFSTQITQFSQQYRLTARESEIVQLLYYGKSGKEICDNLYIADSTLRKHIHNVYEKTGCCSRVQLIRRINAD